jgi:sulfonate transport system permease protein
MSDVVTTSGAGRVAGVRAASDARQGRTFGRLPLGAVPPVLILAAWVAEARTGLLPASLMPSPWLVLQTLRDMVADGSLWRDLAATGTRLAAGFALGSAVAIVLGGLVGASSFARRLLDPTIQAARSVPSIAWVPLFILWFGIFDTSKILLIAVGVFFPVYLNLAAAIGSVDRKLIEVGRVHRLGIAARLWRIQVPASLPGLVTGLRGGLGLGWMFVAAAELMGASDGLGFELMDGDQTGRPERVLAALLVFALCGKATDLALVTLGRPLIAWQDTEERRA